MSRTLHQAAISPAPIPPTLQREFLLNTFAWYVLFDVTLCEKRLGIKYEDGRVPFQSLRIPPVMVTLLFNYLDFRQALFTPLISITPAGTQKHPWYLHRWLGFRCFLFVFFILLWRLHVAWTGLDLQILLPLSPKYYVLFIEGLLWLALTYQCIFSISCYKCSILPIVIFVHMDNSYMTEWSLEIIPFM